MEILLIAHNLLHLLHHLLHLLARLSKQPEIDLALFHFRILNNLKEFLVHVLGRIGTSSLELHHVLKVLVWLNIFNQYIGMQVLSWCWLGELIHVLGGCYLFTAVGLYDFVDVVFMFFYLVDFCLRQQIFAIQDFLNSFFVSLRAFNMLWGNGKLFAWSGKPRVWCVWDRLSQSVFMCSKL